MYPQCTIECPLSASEHVHEAPAELSFDLWYSTPTRFTKDDPGHRRRMLAHYVAGFPGWSGREIDAWWRWFNRQAIGGNRE